ncbi:MAG: hypothetical protein HFI40_11270 [Lachnospiraceae bacterium]|nr:hypothetical protein [Lachnospiraceae bacterium]
MTLTQEDLLAISQILDVKLEPLKGDIASLQEDVASLKEEVSSLKEEVSSLKEEVSSLKEEVSSLKEEVELLKEDMYLVKKDILILKEEQHRTNLIIENELRPQIRLLAENYLPAAKRYLEEAEQIKEMRSDIDMLKVVVEQHSQQLQALV